MVTALLHDGGFQVHASLGESLLSHHPRAETVLLDSWDASRMDRAVKGAHSCFTVTPLHCYSYQLSPCRLFREGCRQGPKAGY